MVSGLLAGGRGGEERPMFNGDRGTHGRSSPWELRGLLAGVRSAGLRGPGMQAGAVTVGDPGAWMSRGGQGRMGLEGVGAEVV